MNFTSNPMPKVVRGGKVAVLYSTDYGSGWFTSNREFPECIFHPELVRLVESNNLGELPGKAMELFDDFYTGGWDSLLIEWVPEGVPFRIEEHDGMEWIEQLPDMSFFVA